MICFVPSVLRRGPRRPRVAVALADAQIEPQTCSGAPGR